MARLRRKSPAPALTDDLPGLNEQTAAAAGVGAGVSGGLLGAVIGASFAERKCTDCGKQIPQGAWRCPHCGAS